MIEFIHICLDTTHAFFTGLSAAVNLHYPVLGAILRVVYIFKLSLQHICETILQSHFLKNFPILHFVSFSLLCLLTIFRRKLSANNEYRRPIEEKTVNMDHSNSDIAVTANSDSEVLNDLTATSRLRSFIVNMSPLSKAASNRISPADSNGVIKEIMKIDSNTSSRSNVENPIEMNDNDNNSDNDNDKTEKELMNDMRINWVTGVSLLGQGVGKVLGKAYSGVLDASEITSSHASFGNLFTFNSRTSENYHKQVLLFHKNDGITIDNVSCRSENSGRRFSLLSSELFLYMMSYLDREQICILGSTCLHIHEECHSNRLWSKLWRDHFESMWQNDEIRKICDRRGIAWGKPDIVSMSYNTEHSLNLNAAINQNENDVIVYEKKTIVYSTPSQGWFLFYLEFEACWLDWLLAGCCTEDFCLIGLRGKIFNITTFLPHHPGSIETLMELCGGDGTETFVNIGHSSTAVNLANMHQIYPPKQNKKKKKKNHASQIEHDNNDNNNDNNNNDNNYDNEDEEDEMNCNSNFEEPLNSHRIGFMHRFQQQMRLEQHIAEKHCTNMNAMYQNTGMLSFAVNQESQSTSSMPTFLPLIPARKNGGSRYHNSVSISIEKYNESHSGPTASASASSGMCRKGCPHVGHVRAFYDPLAQKWCNWWSCCLHAECALESNDENQTKQNECKS